MVQYAFNPVDTKVTEHFLLTQPGVVDASVWYDAGRLQAHVTLLDSADWTARSLRILCACELGLQFTPAEFILMNTRSKAA